MMEKRDIDLLVPQLFGNSTVRLGTEASFTSG
jgi:hypothetical protein